MDGRRVARTNRVRKANEVPGWVHADSHVKPTRCEPVVVMDGGVALRARDATLEDAVHAQRTDF